MRGGVRADRAIAERVFAEHGMDIHFWEHEADTVIHYMAEMAGNQNMAPVFHREWYDLVPAPWCKGWVCRLLLWLSTKQWLPRLRIWELCDPPRKELHIHWSMLLTIYPKWLSYLLYARAKQRHIDHEEMPPAILGKIQAQILCLRGARPVVILTGRRAEGRVTAVERETYLPYDDGRLGIYTVAGTFMPTYMGIPIKVCPFLEDDAVIVVSEEDVKEGRQWSK